MNDKGDWWYDRLTAFGATIDPSVNADMVSPGFWLAKGTEFKITRSDDPYHTPLLETTGNCLRRQTFRSKITSYGNFRNGRVWSSDRCLGSCRVQYGGEYKKTQGFELAECGSGDIQSRNEIGFWCHYSTDGSVMMIGGGGYRCAYADPGMGITETDRASFVEMGDGNVGNAEYDFGHNAYAGNPQISSAYSLNLWGAN